MFQRQPNPFMGLEKSERYHRSALEAEYGAKWICAMSDSSFPRILEMAREGT